MPPSRPSGARRPRKAPWLIVPMITLLFWGGMGLLGASCSPSDTQGSAAQEVGGESGAVGATQERLPPRGEAWVIFGSDTVRAEVARTPEEREQGLMYRTELAPGRGMLFVFDDLQTRSFWMKDTLIPLDIAYIDENLRITDIQAMEPQTSDLHPSARPAMFALEVPMGWFAEKGIVAGAEARVIFGPGM